MEIKILLVAGGTGGHIWPAISFGRWITEKKPGVCVSYVCGSRPLETEIYESAGLNPYILPVEGSPISGRIPEKAGRFCGQVKAFNIARSILKESRPDCCILFGGYVSLPVLFACKTLKIPVVMHEQNAYAGKVTRLASRMGVDIFSGWSECHPLAYSKYTRIGVPVRDFKKYEPKQAWKDLGLPGDLPEGPRVVVFSGSLGSLSIKEKICDAASMDKFKGWNFILPAVADKVEKLFGNVYLLPKIWDAALLFSLADMAVIRGGGSTLTEVGTQGIPSLVIPWYGASDNHQYHNAIAFLAENTAILWDGGGDENEFADRLSMLYEIRKESRQIAASKLYNSTGRICENFWLALSSYF